VVMMLISGYIILVNLLVKNKCTSFGFLLILYNFAIILRSASSLVVLVLHLKIPTGSQHVCYSALFTLMQWLMMGEEIGACLLAHITFIMYYSHKLLADIPVKKLFQCYFAYVLCMHATFNALIIGYDVAAGEHRHAVRPDGYCSSVISGYNTMEIAWASVAVNKTVQFVCFTIFLMYYYKHKINTAEDSYPHRNISKKLIKIGVALGATVGIRPAPIMPA